MKDKIEEFLNSRNGIFILVRTGITGWEIRKKVDGKWEAQRKMTTLIEKCVAWAELKSKELKITR